MAEPMIVVGKKFVYPKNGVMVFCLKHDIDKAETVLKNNFDDKQRKNIFTKFIEHDVTTTDFNILDKVIGYAIVIVSSNVIAEKKHECAVTFIIGLLENLSIKTYVCYSQKEKKTNVELSNFLGKYPIAKRQLTILTEKIVSLPTALGNPTRLNQCPMAILTVYMHSGDEGLLQSYADIMTGTSILCFGRPKQPLVCKHFQPFKADAKKLCADTAGHSLTLRSSKHNIQMIFSVPVHEVLGASFKPFLKVKLSSSVGRSHLRALLSENDAVDIKIFEETIDHVRYLKAYFILPLDDICKIKISEFEEKDYEKYGSYTNYMFPK